MKKVDLVELTLRVVQEEKSSEWMLEKEVGLDKPVEAVAFLGLHDFLGRSFPNVHATSKREIISDYSVFFTWEGTSNHGLS